MLKLRNMRQRLGELIDPATVCRVFETDHGNITWSDLELLASIEDHHRSDNHTEEPTDGD